jgi:hypothetical protein
MAGLGRLIANSWFRSQPKPDEAHNFLKGGFSSLETATNAFTAPK